MIYKKSADENFEVEKYVRGMHENKQNIMVIIKTADGNVIGGYSSSGCEGGHDVWQKDPEAYIYVRSNRGHQPGIYDVRKEYVDTAIAS